MSRWIPLAGKRGWEMGLAAFALLVVGGSAYFTSQDKSVTYKTGASNVAESAQGTLVKKDTPAFSPCETVTTDYALLSSPANTKTLPSCTPLTMPSDFAEPFVGKKVIVSGTVKDGVFYGTTVEEISTP